MMRIHREKPFSVLTTYRPRCVAFLVDLAHEAIDQILDHIVTFNMNSWGGAYNPIIPISQGVLLPGFRPLLEVADPDIVYSFAELSREQIAQLDDDYDPTRFVQHNFDQNGLSPWIPNQATIERVILLTKAKSQITVSGFTNQRAGDTFSLRNFGVASAAYDLSATGQIKVQSESVDACELANLISSGKVVSPRYLSTLAPLKRQFASRGVGFWEFCIYYGSSPWNFLLFWNAAYRTGVADRAIPHWVQEAWLPDGMATEDSVRPLLHLLRKRLFSEEQSVRILSYERTASEMESLAEIIKAKTRRDVSCMRVAPATFWDTPIVDHHALRPSLLQHDHVRGSHFFTSVNRPDQVLDRDESWMADVQIQSVGSDEKVGWWHFPRRSTVAQAVHSTTPSRILSGGCLSVEASSRTVQLDFKLPSRMEFFTELLNPRHRYSNTTDVRYGLSAYAVDNPVRLSDKGRYFEGVVRLFGGLDQAIRWIEHDYWQRVFLDLSVPRHSQQALNKLKKDIRRRADSFIAEFSRDREAAVSLLASDALRSLHHIQRITETFAFDDLKAGLQKRGPSSQKPSVSSCDDAELKRSLTTLCSNGVFLQGCDVRCQRCLSIYWYDINVLAATFNCYGCRSEIALPVELRWRYKLNDLMRAAVRDHGVIPVIRTIAGLKRQSQGFFRALAGVDIVRPSGNGDLKNEIDLCWVSDGEFGISEIKTSSQDFTSSEIDKAIKLAKAVRPDVVLLCALEGPDDPIERASARVKEITSLSVLGWCPSRFGSH